MTYHSPKYYAELRKIRKQEADKRASEQAREQARNQAVRKPTSAECDPNPKREAGEIYSLQADRGARCFRINLYGQESPPGLGYMYAFVWLSGTIFDVD